MIQRDLWIPSAYDVLGLVYLVLSHRLDPAVGILFWGR